MITLWLRSHRIAVADEAIVNALNLTIARLRGSGGSSTAGGRNNGLFAEMGRVIVRAKSEDEVIGAFYRLHKEAAFSPPDPEARPGWYEKELERHLKAFRERPQEKRGGPRAGAGRPRVEEDHAALIREHPHLAPRKGEEDDILRVLHYYGDALVYVQPPRTSSPTPHIHNEHGELVPIVKGLSNSLEIVASLIKGARKKAAEEARNLGIDEKAAEKLEDFAQRSITHRRADDVLSSVLLRRTDTPSLGNHEIDLWRFPVDGYRKLLLPCIGKDGRPGLWDVDKYEVIQDPDIMRSLNISSITPHFTAPDEEAMGWVVNIPADLGRVYSLLTKHYGWRVIDAISLSLLGPSKLSFLLHDKQSDSGKTLLFKALEEAFGERAVTYTGDESKTALPGRRAAWGV